MKPFGNSPPVLGFEGNGLQDQQVKRSLRQFEAFVHRVLPLRLRQESVADLLSKRKGSELAADKSVIRRRKLSHWICDAVGTFQLTRSAAGAVRVLHAVPI